jgi:hypothetical protein
MWIVDTIFVARYLNSDLVVFRRREYAPVLLGVHLVHEVAAAVFERHHLFRREEVFHGQDAIARELKKAALFSASSVDSGACAWWPTFRHAGATKLNFCSRLMLISVGMALLGEEENGAFMDASWD